MKALFAAAAVSKGGGSVASQTASGLRNISDRYIRGGSPALTGWGWSAQAGRIPERGRQESLLMMSQLG